MVTEEIVLSLVGQIYDATADPARWVGFLSRMRDLTGSSLVLIDSHKNLPLLRSEFNWSVGLDSEYEGSYQKYYGSINPFVKAKPQLVKSGFVGTSQMACADDVLSKTEYYNDWMCPQDLFHGIAGFIHKDDQQMITLGFHRPKEYGPYGDEDIFLVKALMPHLQRAFQLNTRIANLQAERDNLGFVLDRLPMGVLMLDNAGQVMLTNHSADIIFGQKDGLKLTRRGVEIASKQQSDVFHKMICGAAQTNQGEGVASGGALAVGRPSMKRPYSVLVVPLPQEGFARSHRRAAVAVFISDPEREVETVDQLLSRIYGLTPAEARLVSLLMQGKSLEVSGEALQITSNTARSSLKSIFAKTQTNRQSEMVRLLLNSPTSLSLPH